LDSDATTTPVLPIVKTVPDNDSVHDGDDACATSVDTASLTTHRPVVCDIHVVNSDVPDAPEDPIFNEDFTSFGFSRVQQLEEVSTGIPDTDDMLFDGIDGIDPRVMSMFHLNIPDSAPAHYDDLGEICLASVPSAIVCTSSLLILADLPRPRSSHVLVICLLCADLEEPAVL
jgi:hypothetical protein